MRCGGWPAFLERAPDTATVEDLRWFQLHLVDGGTSPITLNATITGLKFFFEVTLNQGQLMAKMQPVRVLCTLTVVLSREEAARLIAAAGNLKHQSALSVACGTGLRAGEVVALKVGDIDSQRMTLRIEQGKGRKDRYAMLPPLLLERGVTFHWKDYRAKASTRRKTMTLAADEFMRRFLLQLLPGGFHRIRHYGLLANAGRREHLAQARQLLHVIPLAPPRADDKPVARA